ncbi:MAG: DUF192 domain-containing protein [Holosporales bacterium]|nr:DUF192 domain-containing protein [Holosporales bacterium]
MKKKRNAQIFLLIKSIIILSFEPIQGALAQELTLNIANKVTISVEKATTPKERNEGLMFRRFLSPKHGMLLAFENTKRVSVWMKNTYISLDVLFVSASGRIVRIVPQTTPLSTTSIPSKQPVRFVLELPAGTCKKHNILVGDQILSLIGNETPRSQKTTRMKKVS